MFHVFPALAVVLVLFSTCYADEPVFSGPQIGEKLPPFEVAGVFGELDGKKFDLIQQASGKPLALIFVHARTRPAFGLTNLVMKFVATRSKAGLKGGVIFLTDDATATERWMRQVEKYFPKGVAFGISPDGAEGPGAYGLNRNVTLTVLIGAAGKVTGNFALVQPSIQADGPKILKAIADVTGGGDVPSIEELSGPRYRGQTDRKSSPRKNDSEKRITDPKLTGLLRAVIRKQTSVEDVRKAADEVEKYVESNETARHELARITNTVVNSGRLKNYGTEAAQEKLKEWAGKYTIESQRESKDRESDQKGAGKPADRTKNESP